VFFSATKGAALPLLDRGRTQQVLENLLRQWPDYRGKAIEPVVRDSVARRLPLDDADAHTVASYWTVDGSTKAETAPYVLRFLGPCLCGNQMVGGWVA
jgi:hypothetical protein